MGTFSDIVGAGTTIGNFALQANQLAWQKEAYQTQMQREDTAVQRRAADLEAAGINPLLAAGSAATTSTAPTLSAPQLDLSPAEKAQSIMSQKAMVSKTIEDARASKAIANLKEKEYEGTWGDPIVSAAIKSNIISNARSAANAADKVRQDLDIQKYNYNLAQKEGVRTDINDWSANVANLMGLISKQLGLNRDAGTPFLDAAKEVVSKVINPSGKLMTVPREQLKREASQSNYEKALRSGSVSLQGGR